MTRKRNAQGKVKTKASEGFQPEVKQVKAEPTGLDTQPEGTLPTNPGTNPNPTRAEPRRKRKTRPPPLTEDERQQNMVRCIRAHNKKTVSIRAVEPERRDEENALAHHSLFWNACHPRKHSFADREGSCIGELVFHALVESEFRVLRDHAHELVRVRPSEPESLALRTCTRTCRLRVYGFPLLYTTVGEKYNKREPDVFRPHGLWTGLYNRCVQESHWHHWQILVMWLPSHQATHTLPLPGLQYGIAYDRPWFVFTEGNALSHLVLKAKGKAQPAREALGRTTLLLFDGVCVRLEASLTHNFYWYVQTLPSLGRSDQDVAVIVFRPLAQSPTERYALAFPAEPVFSPPPPPLMSQPSSPSQPSSSLPMPRPSSPLPLSSSCVSSALSFPEACASRPNSPVFVNITDSPPRPYDDNDPEPLPEAPLAHTKQPL